MEVVFKQMQIAGNRPRTIQSYDYIFNKFVQFNGLVFIEEINSDCIYNYLDNIDVSIQTKKIRLKTLKAVLGKLYFNNGIKDNFWRNIHIKFDKKIKASAKECDIEKLFHFIDKSNFIGFGDTTAIKLMMTEEEELKNLKLMKELMGKMEDFRTKIDAGFDRMEERFDRWDVRFDFIDSKLDSIDCPTVGLKHR